MPICASHRPQLPVGRAFRCPRFHEVVKKCNERIGAVNGIRLSNSAERRHSYAGSGSAMSRGVCGAWRGRPACAAIAAATDFRNRLHVKRKVGVTGGRRGMSDPLHADDAVRLGRGCSPPEPGTDVQRAVRVQSCPAGRCTLATSAPAESICGGKICGGRAYRFDGRARMTAGAKPAPAAQFRHRSRPPRAIGIRASARYGPPQRYFRMKRSARRAMRGTNIGRSNRLS